MAGLVKMATATLEDFMAASDGRTSPEPEDLVGLQTGQLVEQYVDTGPAMDDGVVVVETSDGEIMDVEKRIAFLSPILQLGCARPESVCPGTCAC